MPHYDDEDLILYRLDPGRDPDMAAHVARCDECRAELEELVWIDAALRDPETWMHAETLTRQSRYAAEFEETKARIEAEDRAAERLLTPLLRSPFQFRLADLAENGKARTAGVVRRLCTAAHDLHERQPQFSLEVATTACQIARTLEQGPKMPGRYCTALSLRERANALRYLGRFGEALQALNEAEQFLDSSVDAHDRAVVWYIRGIVLVETGRLDEASLLLQEAARVFRDHGDTSRELGALLVAAVCLSLEGRHAEAASAYENIAAKARTLHERSILARAAIGAANSYLELSTFEEAERYYLEAFVLFDELGLITEKARVEWALALMMVRQADSFPCSRSSHPLHNAALSRYLPLQGAPPHRRPRPASGGFMRNLRKWVLVLSLAASVTAGAARRVPIPDISERAPATTLEAIATRVLEFFVLYNRFSIPPG